MGDIRHELWQGTFDVVEQFASFVFVAQGEQAAQDVAQVFRRPLPFEGASEVIEGDAVVAAHEGQDTSMAVDGSEVGLQVGASQLKGGEFLFAHDACCFFPVFDLGTGSDDVERREVHYPVEMALGMELPCKASSFVKVEFGRLNFPFDDFYCCALFGVYVVCRGEVGLIVDRLENSLE